MDLNLLTYIALSILQAFQIFLRTPLRERERERKKLREMDPEID